MSRLHDHKTGKIREQERIKKLKKEQEKNIAISELALATFEV